MLPALARHARRASDCGAELAPPRRWMKFKFAAAIGGQLAGFVAIGVVITAGIEWLATRAHWAQGWNNLPTMLLVPGTGIGLAPLLQWVMMPLLAA